MSDFWKSELGELTGDSTDAFVRTFKKIPDGTKALAKIESFTNQAFGDNKFLQITWALTDGEFVGQKVFHKINVFDNDSNRRHRALNMLMLIYKLFNKKPKSSNPPSDEDLSVFVGSTAGIQIQETEPNDKGKTYNWVSEVHPAKGFVCESGFTKVISKAPLSLSNDNDAFGEDIPF